MMNIINDETFKINKNAKITIKEIGKFKHKVICIDDFYENPDDVYNITQNTSYTTDRSVIFSAGVARADINYNLSNIKLFLTELIRKEYNEDIHIYSLPFIASIYKKGCVPDFEYTHIHNDGSDYAFVVYLNKETIEGGTSLWSHRSTGLESIPSTQSSKMSYEELEYVSEVTGTLDINELREFNSKVLNKNHKLDSYVNEQHDWEMLHLSKMKYNRMIFYPASYFHSMHVTRDMYIDDWRIVQVGMIN
jgi:hypothetical protein